MARSSSLDAEAQAWAQHIASINQASHNPDTRGIVLRICVGCQNTGENIAWFTPPSVDRAWGFWMGSAPHRANIERTQSGVFGVGAALAPDGQTMHYVQMFGWY
jgi:uncharacterized protein YkwD